VSWQVGFDASRLINPNVFLQFKSRQQHGGDSASAAGESKQDNGSNSDGGGLLKRTRLFLVRGVDPATAAFATRTRKEIAAIAWVPVAELPR
jgi:hypothetical protein